MTIIYEPSGRAREYAALAANLYKGCSHACQYCFGPQALHLKRPGFFTGIMPKKDALLRFRKDAEKLRGDEREILLSFVTDPYQPLEMQTGLTRQAIQVLIDSDLAFTVLTKGGMRASRDFDLLANYDKARFGTTLIFTLQKDADHWEPKAASIQDRIKAIELANQKGIRTWVSLEPVIDPNQALALIDRLHPIVDHWKVGKLNYKKLDVDWIGFRTDVTALLDSLGADYYIKKSLTDL